VQRDANGALAVVVALGIPIATLGWSLFSHRWAVDSSFSPQPKGRSKVHGPGAICSGLAEALVEAKRIWSKLT
jgi:hypothetical protein